MTLIIYTQPSKVVLYRRHCHFTLRQSIHVTFYLSRPPQALGAKLTPPPLHHQNVERIGVVKRALVNVVWVI